MLLRDSISIIVVIFMFASLLEYVGKRLRRGGAKDCKVKWEKSVGHRSTKQPSE